MKRLSFPRAMAGWLQLRVGMGVTISYIDPERPGLILGRDRLGNEGWLCVPSLAQPGGVSASSQFAQEPTPAAMAVPQSTTPPPVATVAPQPPTPCRQNFAEDELWICTGCSSDNGLRRGSCYFCDRPRPPTQPPPVATAAPQPTAPPVAMAASQPSAAATAAPLPLTQLPAPNFPQSPAAAMADPQAAAWAAPPPPTGPAAAPGPPPPPTCPFSSRACSTCGRQFRVCITHRRADHSEVQQCLLAQGLQKSKGGVSTCFSCRAQQGRGTLQNVLEGELPPECRHHGVTPPIPRLQHLQPLFPALDNALMDFWSQRPFFIWYHQGGGGPFPTGELCQDDSGRMWYKSIWDGGQHGMRQWSRIDFFRPAPDWVNADWDETLRGCPRISSFLLHEFRASQRATWMECLVGAVYHVGTQAVHLPNNILSVRGPAGPHAMLFQLAELWRCLVALQIPMPPLARRTPPSFSTLPSIEWDRVPHV